MAQTASVSQFMAGRRAKRKRKQARELAGRMAEQESIVLACAVARCKHKADTVAYVCAWDGDTRRKAFEMPKISHKRRFKEFTIPVNPENRVWLRPEERQNPVLANYNSGKRASGMTPADNGEGLPVSFLDAKDRAGTPKPHTVETCEVIGVCQRCNAEYATRTVQAQAEHQKRQEERRQEAERGIVNAVPTESCRQSGS